MTLLPFCQRAEGRSRRVSFKLKVLAQTGCTEEKMRGNKESDDENEGNTMVPTEPAALQLISLLASFSFLKIILTGILQ